MDLATVIGFIAGLILFTWAVVSGAGDKVSGFWDIPSIIIVIGGGICSTMLSVRMSRFLSLLSVVKHAFLHRGLPPVEAARLLVRLSEVARREGILALESEISRIPDAFVARSLQAVVDGTDADAVQQIMQNEIDGIDARHAEGKQVLDLLAKYAPAYGMIGTLVGLVIMLQNMDDPKKIGPGMAVALLTTLYGAVIANMVCLPLVDKLANRHAQEMHRMAVVRTGILGLQAGDNPRILQAKLAVFLDPKERAVYLATARGAGAPAT